MRETEGLTLLGNKNVKYDTDYNPDLLETFENKHSSRRFARSPGSLISPILSSHMCLPSEW